MKLSVLVYRYAKAFFNTATASITRPMLDQFESCAAFLNKRKHLLYFIQVSHAHSAAKQTALMRVMELFQLADIARPLVNLLLVHRRIELLPAIFAYLPELYYEHHRIMVFHVGCSKELSEGELSIIKHFLEKKSKKQSIMHPSIDKNLIAGIALQSTRLRWEHSVRKELDLLRRLQAA